MAGDRILQQWVFKIPNLLPSWWLSETTATTSGGHCATTAASLPEAVLDRGGFDSNLKEKIKGVVDKKITPCLN